MGGWYSFCTQNLRTSREKRWRSRLVKPVGGPLPSKKRQKRGPRVGVTGYIYIYGHNSLCLSLSLSCCTCFFSPAHVARGLHFLRIAGLKVLRSCGHPPQVYPNRKLNARDICHIFALIRAATRGAGKGETFGVGEA